MYNELFIFCSGKYYNEHTNFLIFLLFHLKALNTCNTLSMWTNAATQKSDVLLAFLSNFKLLFKPSDFLL